MSIDDIAREHVINRAMAREVCQILQAKGLVTVTKRVGVTVRSQDEWQLFDPQVIAWRLRADYKTQIGSLTELRLAVEPWCASLAAERATSKQRGQLRGYARQMRTIGTPTKDNEFNRRAYLDMDQNFHGTLLVASRNEMFQALRVAVGPVLDARMDETNNDFPRWPMPVALVLHEAVAEAIYQGASDLAALCMTAILNEVKGKLDPETIGKVRQAFERVGLAQADNLKVLHDAARAPE